MSGEPMGQYWSRQSAMTIPEMCPACLDILPYGYPFDHVRIDRALASMPGLFADMTREERREMIRTARRRGLTDNLIGVRFHRSIGEIHRLMGEKHVKVVRYQRLYDARIRELWEQGMSDRVIAEKLTIRESTVRNARHRQNLPAIYTSGGRRVEARPAEAVPA